MTARNVDAQTFAPMIGYKDSAASAKGQVYATMADIGSSASPAKDTVCACMEDSEISARTVVGPKSVHMESRGLDAGNATTSSVRYLTVP